MDKINTATWYAIQFIPARYALKDLLKGLNRKIYLGYRPTLEHKIAIFWDNAH